MKPGPALEAWLQDEQPKNGNIAPLLGSDVTPTQNVARTRALVDAQSLYPNDGVARHRFVTRAVASATSPADSSSRENRKDGVAVEQVDGEHAKS